MFYTLYSSLKKEGESMELVLGDGILGCNAEKRIYHHILLQKVDLKFNANIPEFRLELSDKTSELYKSIFTLVNNYNMELLLELYEEFEKEEFSPLDSKR